MDKEKVQKSYEYLKEVKKQKEENNEFVPDTYLAFLKGYEEAEKSFFTSFDSKKNIIEFLEKKKEYNSKMIKENKEIIYRNVSDSLTDNLITRNNYYNRKNKEIDEVIRKIEDIFENTLIKDSDKV